jgi:hypothetical protein
MDKDTVIYTLILGGDDHTFYANGILSHNKSPKPQPPVIVNQGREDTVHEDITYNPTLLVCPKPDIPPILTLPPVVVAPATVNYIPYGTTLAVNNEEEENTTWGVSTEVVVAAVAYVQSGYEAATAPYVAPSPTFSDRGSSQTNTANTSNGGGCCFIMLEARYGNGTMDKVVRRYRDEYMTDRNRRGYYKLAEVLVPLMRKSRVFKWVVTKTFADPLVSYGKYYYGENKIGVIYSPVKNLWMKVFDAIGGETEFIRENGEVV